MIVTLPLLSLLLASAAAAATASPASGLKRRADDKWPIKNGYVAFGDSYAAGMGTGTTSTDKCRVGSNNFAELLYKWTNNDQIDFQKHMCSGDTTDNIDKQISQWTRRNQADLATISIGGNDVGFSNLIYYCIITFNHAVTPGYNKKYCDQAKDKANKLLDNQGDGGMKDKLKKTYKKIYDASGRSDFHLYVTSYAKFFNEETGDCDKTTFDYLWAQYNPPWDPRYVYLTKALRKEMNDLLVKFNHVIAAAVEDVNDEIQRTRVHYVDIDTKFTEGKHRWCEEGDFHEPEPNREDTWFFLSGWKDVPMDSANGLGGVIPVLGSITGVVDGIIGAVDQAAAEDAEIQYLKDNGGLKLPDGKDEKCLGELGDSPDPVEKWKCFLAIDVALDPEGEIAKRVKAGNEAIERGDFESEDIPWLAPTRQVKTFHPRSPGMQGYRDAIIAQITNFQAADTGGKCTLHVSEARTCEDPARNLYAKLTIKNAHGDTLYSTPGSTTSPLGRHIDDADRLKVQEEGMSEELLTVGEHDNDYIQFYYGEQAWRSTTTEGDAKCKLVGENWPEFQDSRDKCEKDMNTAADSREFECEYLC